MNEKKHLMNDKKREKAIEQLNKPDNLRLLYIYANRFYKFITGPFPGGIEPNDVVHQAITRLLTDEDRTWDDSKYPDVTIPLRGIIRSIISHFPEQPYHRDRIRPKDAEGNELNIEKIAPVENNNSFDSIDFSRLKNEIEAIIEDDDELLEIYFAILEGYDRPKEMAKHLELDVKEINNRLKRIRRKCQGKIKIGERI